MIQQLSRHAGHTGTFHFAPCFHTGTDPVNKRKLDKLPDIIVLIGSLTSNKISGWTAALLAHKGLSV